MRLFRASARRDAAAAVSVLGHERAADAGQLCAHYPLTSTLAAVQVVGGRFDTSTPGSRMLGIDGEQGLEALTWVGANIVPVGTTAEQRPAIAQTIADHGRASSSVLGDAEQVLSLWSFLEQRWGRPREIRGNQPLLVMDSPATVEPDPQVRRGTVAEAPIVAPASVAMFIEEVGYDPTRYGNGYVRRVRSLLSLGRTWIRTEPHPETGQERVVFKADVGALALGVAQVQGVWVAPDRRGQGLGSRGMAAVVRDVLADVAPTVSLYVNDYNTAGLATYRRLGMRQEGTYATVVL
ncbi:GNAT family N-acetyltransferase [Georgenia sp. Z1344]|uniref:GNAT family N-acetyltransferase n=1 Tax=Georgenia sp. Z1344 TaxID=3416706 RepID=UPI003CFA5085